MRRRRGVKRDRDLTNGPGKLCQAMDIGRRHNRASLQTSPIQILVGDPVDDDRVAITPRIGITQCADWPLRWVISDSDYLSKRTI